MLSTSVEADVRAAVPVDNVSRVFSRILVVALVVTALAFAFVPWQQTTLGRGRVIAYAPADRQQTIDAPLDGRVARWHVQEGSHVAAGDRLVDVTDNDPDILVRLAAEREAISVRVDAARTRVVAIDQRIRAMGSSQKSAVLAASQRSHMGGDRLSAADHAVLAAKAAAKAAALNYERQEALFDQGLTSKRSVELAEADEAKTRTDVDRAVAALSAARAELSALSADVEKVDNDSIASISDAQAARASAESEIASGRAELTRIEGRLARQETQHVKAPSAGTVLRVIARQGAEMVKAGEPIALFAPDTTDRAVEMLIPGNDVNLVQKGRAARLQFEGWPAVQFSGWPSAAVGTYGGIVAFVDPMDDGQGRFRVVVLPDNGTPWPDALNLRQGTRASGWVLLGRVPLGYELWRQFNDFPPEWTGGAQGPAPGKEKEKSK
jgi:membrane fusion protein, adhesin transport system